MDANSTISPFLFVLLNAIQKRRNILINNLVKSHNDMIDKMEHEKRIIKRSAIAQLNARVPSMFFSSVHPRFRSIQRLQRAENYWVTLKQPGNEKLYFEAFRMRLETFHLLCQKLEPFLKNSTCFVVPPLPIDKQVAVCLYKLASCAEYRVVGDVFGIHKSTVHKYFHAVVAAIIELKSEFIKFPNLEEALEMASKFEEKCHIPNIIGAIDGTHIPVLPPSIGYLDYINRKGWPSIVMQGVVDNKYRFIDVSVKHPGSAHDALVFKESGLYKNSDDIIPKFIKMIDDMPTPLFLIGDPAYPLLPWLMKPYVGRLTPEEESFNVYLSSARMVVENAFGRLKGRWRSICKRIDVNPDFVPNVVLACAILHNFVENNKEHYLDIWSGQVAQTEKEYPQPVCSANIFADSQATPKNLRNNLNSYLKNNFPLRMSHF